MGSNKEDTELWYVGNTHQVNWRGCGVEAELKVTPKDVEELPYEIVIKKYHFESDHRRKVTQMLFVWRTERAHRSTIL